MAEEVKHTPGPWKLLAVGDNQRFCPADQNNHSILTLEDEGSSTFACVYEESDAHLIAAAPDLLEALKETLFLASAYGPEGKSPTEENAILDRARAAIAKALARLPTSTDGRDA